MVPHQFLLVLRAFRSVLPPGGAAHRLRVFVIAALLACAAPAVRAQTPGAPDLSFETGSAINGGVRVVVPAGEGKVYVGGYFTTVRGAMRNRIARLNADGTADETFNPGTGVNGGVEITAIHSVAVQADGRVLIGGDFTSYNGTARSGIARLNSDGSLDLSFNPGTGASGVDYYPGIYSIAVQTDGKVLIGGAFTSYNGAARNGITRLNSDGSDDPSFTGTGIESGIESDYRVYSIAMQADGKVFIGGNFSTYNGTARTRIARLNSNGSLDTSFNPGTGPNDPTLGNASIRSVVVQGDGKVLIGGDFTNYRGTGRNRIARLNSNGTLDTSFNPGSGATDDDSFDSVSVNSIAVQPDGKVLIGGAFISYNGTARNGIARLNSNGSLDTSFNPGSGTTYGGDPATVETVALQADAKVLIGGGFTTYNETDRAGIARLNSDGSPDPSFNPGTGANSELWSIAVQTDGKVLIGGGFTTYNGAERNGLARLNSDGSLDTSFSPTTSFNHDTVHSIAVQADEKVLIGGSFSNYNTTGRVGVARLNSDGSLDTSFNPPSSASGTVYSIVLQPDGKVLIGGDFFIDFNGTTLVNIARLNSDGSLDMSFNTGVRFDLNPVYSVAVQPDGKVLVGGYYIARVNSDGSPDGSFNPYTEPDTGVYSIAVQPDGKVLVGGAYYGVPARKRIARLNSNGSLDASFNPGTGANSQVFSITLQADGKVFISGDFTIYNGVARNGIARLNSDGSVDTSFDIGTGASGYVRSLAMQADGKVLIGGRFSSYNGTARIYLARVANDPAIQSIVVPNPSQVQWLRGGAAPEVGQVSFEYSADGASWTVLGAGTHISGGWELTGLNLSLTGYIRARGRVAGGILNGSSSVIEQVLALGPDNDNDGLLDSWELTYWPTTNGHKASDDFDGDGLLELLELGFGLNPTVADAALRPLVVEEGGYLTITITKHAGVTYEVQTAGTLLSGQPDSFSTDSTTVLINDASTLKVRDNFPIGIGSASRFLRVKVIAAP